MVTVTVSPDLTHMVIRAMRRVAPAERPPGAETVTALSSSLAAFTSRPARRAWRPMGSVMV